MEEVRPAAAEAVQPEVKEHVPQNPEVKTNVKCVENQPATIGSEATPAMQSRHTDAGLSEPTTTVLIELAAAPIEHVAAAQSEEPAAASNDQATIAPNQNEDIIPSAMETATDCEEALKDMNTDGNAKATTILGETTKKQEAPEATNLEEEAHIAPPAVAQSSEHNEIAPDAMETEVAVERTSQAVTATDENVPVVQFTPESDETVVIVTHQETTNEGAQHTGLAQLAEYDSDCDSDESSVDGANEPASDTESVIEITATAASDYRHQVVEIDSDSDSSSGADSDTDHLAKLRKEIEKRIGTTDATAGDDDDDDDDDEEGGGSGRGKKRQPPKVKGEMLLDDLPPIQDLHITVPEEDCVELGRVHSIVEQLVLVSVLPDSILLDLETVLFLERGKRVLGEVFDVLGQVADPLYCVRFNTHEQIAERAIAVGDVVYVAPKTQYTQYVILSSLMKMRGSDASWENDVEPPPRYIDYSDDEQERTARAQLRNRNRPTDHDDPTKRVRSDATASTSFAAASERSSPRAHHQQQQYQQYQPRGRGGGRGNYRQSQYNGPRGHNPNHNASSWHSNYYVPMRQPTPSYYRHPPPPQFNPAYGPPPHHMPPAPPMYVLNPYAIRPPVLPPPPPPGTD